MLNDIHISGGAITAALLALAVAYVAISAYGQDFPQMPDPVLTPGAVGDTNPNIICVPGYSKRHRIYQIFGRVAYEKMTETVLNNYHLPLSAKNQVEFDDRVEISIGGSQTATAIVLGGILAYLNIWPQKCDEWKQDQYGRHCIAGDAYLKDLCEFKIHAKVCYSHELAPIQAQGIFMNDWRNYCQTLGIK